MLELKHRPKWNKSNIYFNKVQEFSSFNVNHWTISKQRYEQANDGNIYVSGNEFLPFSSTFDGFIQQNRHKFTRTMGTIERIKAKKTRSDENKNKRTQRPEKLSSANKTNDLNKYP